MTELSKPKVLLAEDSLFNQKIISMMLTRLGVQVDTASNGYEVLEKCAQQHYALILMDCQMPLLDGFNTAQSLRDREAETGTHTPIIAITADQSQDLATYLASGMDDYVNKPLAPELLAMILKRWLVTPLS